MLGEIVRRGSVRHLGRTALQGEVAWVATLNIASQQQTHTEPFPVTYRDELASEQWKDPVIGKILELKQNSTELTEDRRRTLDKLQKNSQESGAGCMWRMASCTEKRLVANSLSYQPPINRQPSLTCTTVWDMLV